jgi:DNA-binding IclR family transcriptional regulator
LHAVAAPVWGSHGELAAIIAVQGPASRFHREAKDVAVEPLLEHARDVSLELGWTGLVREAVR